MGFVHKTARPTGRRAQGVRSMRGAPKMLGALRPGLAIRCVALPAHGEWGAVAGAARLRRQPAAPPTKPIAGRPACRLRAAPRSGSTRHRCCSPTPGPAATEKRWLRPDRRDLSLVFLCHHAGRRLRHPIAYFNVLKTPAPRLRQAQADRVSLHGTPHRRARRKTLEVGSGWSWPTWRRRATRATSGWLSPNPVRRRRRRAFGRPSLIDDGTMWWRAQRGGLNAGLAPRRRATHSFKLRRQTAAPAPS